MEHKCVAITDHETTSSFIRVERYYDKIKKNNPDFKVLRGNEIYLCRNGLTAQNFNKEIDKYYHFLLIAKDLTGAKQLMELSTRAWMRMFVERRMQRVPTYYSDIFDIIVTGTIEKTIIDGKLNGTERRLYFRGDGYVEAGTRFSSNSVPEYLVVDDDPKEFAKNFLQTIKEGMRNSATKPMEKEQVKKELKEEKKQAEKDLKQLQEKVEEQEKAEEEQNIDELKAKLKSLMTTTESKNKVKEFMKGNGVKSVKDLNVEQLEELIGLLS